MEKEILLWWVGIFTAMLLGCLFAYGISHDTNDDSIYRLIDKYFGSKVAEIIKEFI